jgi:hypothetical protein
MKTLTAAVLTLLLAAPSARAENEVLVCVESESRFLSIDFSKAEEQFLFRGLEAANIESGVGYTSLGATTDDSNPEEIVRVFTIVRGKLPSSGRAPSNGNHPTVVRLYERAHLTRVEVYTGVFGAFGRPAFKASCQRRK